MDTYGGERRAQSRRRRRWPMRCTAQFSRTGAAAFVTIRLSEPAVALWRWRRAGGAAMLRLRSDRAGRARAGLGVRFEPHSTDAGRRF